MTARHTTKKITKVAKTAKVKETKKKDTKKKASKKKKSNANTFDDLVNFQIFEAKYKTRLTKSYKERKPYVPEDKTKLTAVIPGTLLKFYKKEGCKVKEGTKVLVIEAMKMKNQILAPVSGVIKKIHVEEGSIVSKNQLLIEFEKENVEE
jgi:biotin carboxyl carrier protein